ncbi:MAG: type IX secretion system membrane protein PorP/SprF [Crocinitomicaceae bacterium]|nr:type IX secretion system membrane protein PorP/SprF [Crocinitomicaceae bacterium]
MSNPSFTNIDLWLFELAEGNLTASQIEQLELFLLQHPELDVERDMWEMAKVAPIAIAYPEQEKLERRQPVAWFALGTTSMLVLTLLGFALFSEGDVSQFDSITLADNTENNSSTETGGYIDADSDNSNVQAYNVNEDSDNASVNGANGSTALATSNSNGNNSGTSGTNGSQQTNLASQGNGTGTANGNSTVNNGSQPSNASNNNSLGNNTSGNGLVANGNSTVNNGTHPSNASNNNPVGNNASGNGLVANGNGTVNNGTQPSNASNNNSVGNNASGNGLATNVANASFGSLNVPANATLHTVGGLALNGIATFENSPVAELVPYQPMTFDVLEEDDYALTADREKRTYGIVSEEYHVSLRSKFNAFARRLKRAIDNPVALKNFRDPHYHVPGMLPMDINMSSTGTMLSTRIQTNTRFQWLGQENQQMMNEISVDGYAYGIRGGVGLQVYHGMYADGSINVANAALTYSPKISISRTISLEPSLRFTMGNMSLTQSKLDDVTNVEVDRGNAQAFYPEGNPTGKSLWYQDLGVGLMVNTEWFFAGVQLDNLFRHRENIYNNDVDNPNRADLHFIGTIGTDWVSRKENLGFSPYLVYQKNDRLSEAWLGANFRWNWFTVGAAVSSDLAPAASIGLKFDHFAMTYNADYTQSQMTGIKSLSHQLTLRFVGSPSRMGRRLLNL